MPLTSAEKMRILRRRNILDGVCKNKRDHGPATHGIRCKACHEAEIQRRREKRQQRPAS